MSSQLFTHAPPLFLRDRVVEILIALVSQKVYNG